MLCFCIQGLLKRQSYVVVPMLQSPEFTLWKCHDWASSNFYHLFRFLIWSISTTRKLNLLWFHSWISFSHGVCIKLTCNPWMVWMLTVCTFLSYRNTTIVYNSDHTLPISCSSQEWTLKMLDVFQRPRKVFDQRWELVIILSGQRGIFFLFFHVDETSKNEPWSLISYKTFNGRLNYVGFLTQ